MTDGKQLKYVAHKLHYSLVSAADANQFFDAEPAKNGSTAPVLTDEEREQLEQDLKKVTLLQLSINYRSELYTTVILFFKRVHNW